MSKFYFGTKQLKPLHQKLLYTIPAKTFVKIAISFTDFIENLAQFSDCEIVTTAVCAAKFCQNFRVKLSLKALFQAQFEPALESFAQSDYGDDGWAKGHKWLKLLDAPD